MALMESKAKLCHYLFVNSGEQRGPGLHISLEAPDKETGKLEAINLFLPVWDVVKLLVQGESSLKHALEESTADTLEAIRAIIAQERRAEKFMGLGRGPHMCEAIEACLPDPPKEVS